MSINNKSAVEIFVYSSLIFFLNKQHFEEENTKKKQYKNETNMRAILFRQTRKAIVWLTMDHAPRHTT